MNKLNTNTDIEELTNSIKEFKNSIENHITSLRDEMDSISSKLNGMRRDLDEIHYGSALNIQHSNPLRYENRQVSSVQRGPQIMHFSTGKSTKMQVLSQLNVGL